MKMFEMGKQFKLTVSHMAIHGILIAFSIMVLIPLGWAILVAFKPQVELFVSSSVLPKNPTLSNFSEAWSRMPFTEYLWNTIVFTVGLLLVQLCTLTLAAYAFARLQFKGRKVLFYLFLTQLMIAPQSLILPNYLTIKSLGLLDTRLGLMMPYFASAFGTFLLRQAFRTIPGELEDSARIDGCGSLRFLWHIGIPLVRPALLAFSIISLVFHWSEFFWPFIITETPRARTLTVGLAMFSEQARSGAEWTLLMAITLVIIAPMLAAFLIFQRSFVNSFMRSGMKA